MRGSEAETREAHETGNGAANRAIILASFVLFEGSPLFWAGFEEKCLTLVFMPSITRS